ncbi:type II secretion system minor pseudopilin GspJ [Pseudoalteromonas sp. MMG022]|uniref:type II secretion system minor pseudopilin GspJ n=1 Tax=Pseudoalteromonas sp. MMG022 TaxID=2909978 RepID=UPI001F00D208|nr:type II secretion system minor pseudopilin GspJ [Pseudoalteromonas sp. MMG022]MCF6437359.1 type II secretion system minor pseudopilin GspJ [Pseudoalteromonas sp. MMG022]
MRQRGFTLLEVMVALGILAFVVMATHQILDSTIKAKEASEETIAELESLQTTFRLMDQDFSQMTKREVRNEAGDTNPSYVLHGRFELQSQYDGIAFVRDGWTNPISLLPRSELQAVGYRVIDDNLERIYRIYVDELDGAEPRSQVVIKNVEELKFEFLDDKQKWQEEWNKKALPLAVAVTLQLKDTPSIRRLFLTPGDGKEQQASSSRNSNSTGQSQRREQDSTQNERNRGGRG